jgi:hypothetical protein
MKAASTVVLTNQCKRGLPFYHKRGAEERQKPYEYSKLSVCL